MTAVDVLNTMEYGPAPESSQPARDWIAAHGGEFHLFIGGRWQPAAGGRTFETSDPAAGDVLAVVAQAGNADVAAAVEAARAALPGWIGLGANGRARFLYALARHIQKQARLLAVLETLDNGKPIRESRDLDIPLAARHFYHHAGWAQLLPTAFAGHGPIGVIGQIIPWNFPLLMLAWKIAPALAAGNTVVLKPAEFTPLTALAFAEICERVGLPAGVVNIVTGDGSTGQHIVAHAGVDKIAFTGSTEVGRAIREATAGSGKRISLELGGKSPIVVFEDADIDSAVEGIVDAIWFNQGEVCCAGSRLLVQESVSERFLMRLRARMETLRVGDPLDKATDVGAVIADVQLRKIDRLVTEGVAEGARRWQPAGAVPMAGCFYPPTLITNVSPSSSLVQEEIFGPVLVAMSFRTPQEAVELANNTRYGLAASVWTENVNVALDVARRIKAGTVWVNCTNLFDAASGFGGYRESGYGREGGREGMWEYLREMPERAQPQGTAQAPPDLLGTSTARLGAGGAPPSPSGEHFAQGGPPADGPPVKNTADGNGASAPVGEDDADGNRASSSSGEDAVAANYGYAPAAGDGGAGRLPRLDRTPKLYIGGRQTRPDSGYSLSVTGANGRPIGEVGDGNRKDIRNAVEAARAASGWAAATAHGRAQVLYYIAENLEARRNEFVALLVSGGTERTAAAAEFDLSIDRIFTYAAWADKYDGLVHETPFRGVTMAIPEPLGVVGIGCPPSNPMLGLISAAMPAVAMGCRVIVVPSEQAPLAAVSLYQVLDTSDLPGGVINIVTGRTRPLMETLAAHDDVAGVWFWGDHETGTQIERLSAGNLKQTWVHKDHPADWLDPVRGCGERFLRHATQVKNIWLPHGA